MGGVLVGKGTNVFMPLALASTGTGSGRAGPRLMHWHDPSMIRAAEGTELTRSHGPGLSGQVSLRLRSGQVCLILAAAVT